MKSHHTRNNFQQDLFAINPQGLIIMLMKPLSVTCLLFLSITLLNCGGSDPQPDPVVPTEMEKVTEMLTSSGGVWSTTGNVGISVDGIDVTEKLFAGFSIKFTPTTLTTTGTTPVWLRSDTWTFKDETAKVMIRGQDDKEVTISSISETQLKLILEWDSTTYDGGRSNSLGGTHEFILNR